MNGETLPNDIYEKYIQKISEVCDEIIYFQNSFTKECKERKIKFRNPDEWYMIQFDRILNNKFEQNNNSKKKGR